MLGIFCLSPILFWNYRQLFALQIYLPKTWAKLKPKEEEARNALDDKESSRVQS